MKFRFPSSLPSPADGTLLPAVLAGVLGMALTAQLLWAAREPELPPTLAVTAPRANFSVSDTGPVIASRAIFDRPLFAPRQSAAATSDGALPPMLGGAVIAGTVSIRGRTYAVVRRPSGAISNMAVGGRLGGWRLAAIGEQGATFVRGSEQRVVAFGTRPTSAEEAEVEQ